MKGRLRLVAGEQVIVFRLLRHLEVDATCATNASNERFQSCGTIGSKSWKEADDTL
jgi:hypothetical protein